MPKYDFMQVDAFTTRPLGGNPCAILFGTDDLDSATMLAIAKEMNLSETSFVRQSDEADFGVRYFTPAEEIPLAGHPTIATTYALVQRGEITLQGASTTITLELPAGIIDVEIIQEEGEEILVVMSQMKPQFLEVLEPASVMPVFGLTPQDGLPGALPQIVSTGTPQLMIPVNSLESLRRTGGYRGRRYVCPPFWRSARYTRRSVHWLSHRWHGSLPVALWPDPKANLHCRARALDEPARHCPGGGGWPAGRYCHR
jgi:trans-2,3-dihydro-3-hydroxyanthranilate isomerase